MRITYVLIALSIAAAGCLSTPPTVDPDAGGLGAVPNYLLDEFPLDLDHDHKAPELHAAAHNVDLVGHSPCTKEGTLASSPAGFTDIAFHGDFAFVGHAKGFCILHLHGAGEMDFASSYEGEATSDLEVSADGRYVFLPTQRNKPESLVDGGDPTGDLPRGVSVINVKDPFKPVFESYYQVLTNGVHTLTPYKMGDRQLVFIQTYDWFPPQGIWPSEAERVPVPEQNLAPTQRIEVTELKEVAGKMTLQFIGRYAFPRPVAEPSVYYFPHDSFAQQHPLTKQHLLYVAYWDAGLVTVDITDPSRPRTVSTYDDKAPSIYNAYHDVKAFDELIEGRHITVTGPEIGSGPEAAHVRIFDTTDPMKPVQLSAWRLPGNPGTPGGYLFSPHVFTLHDGRIYLGHNHGGVWVLEVGSLADLVEPKAAGFYFPRGNEATGDLSPTADVWGAYFHDGYVYATEHTSGVHVLKFAGDAEPAMPAVEASHHD